MAERLFRIAGEKPPKALLRMVRASGLGPQSSAVQKARTFGAGIGVIGSEKAIVRATEGLDWIRMRNHSDLIYLLSDEWGAGEVFSYSLGRLRFVSTTDNGGFCAPGVRGVFSKV